jgi:hypothetical protein
MRIGDDGGLRPAEQVDEARRDHAPARVDGGRRGRLGKVADGDNPIAAHADVPAEPRRAGAVDDAAVGDFEVEWLGVWGSHGRAGHHQDRDRKKSQSLKV